MRFLQVAVAFLLAVIVGAVLVTVIATQVNLAALASVGTEISMDVRMDASLRDLAGFLPTIGPILLIGYLIAFLVARAVIKVIPSWRTFGYTLAGFVTVLTVMLAIKAYYGLTLHSGITPVPAARTMLGLLSMCAGGAVGGLTFALIAPRRA